MLLKSSIKQIACFRWLIVSNAVPKAKLAELNYDNMDNFRNLSF